MSLYLHDLVQNEIGLRGMEFTCEAMALPKNLSPEPILKLPLTVYCLTTTLTVSLNSLSIHGSKVRSPRSLHRMEGNHLRGHGSPSQRAPPDCLLRGWRQVYRPRPKCTPPPEAGCTRCPPPARPLLPSSHLLPLLSGFFFDTFFPVLLAHCKVSLEKLFSQKCVWNE